MSGRIAVVGGGLVGMCCALALRDRGFGVRLYEAGRLAEGASGAAAGMLAPAFEAASESGAHPHLYPLCDEAASMWPGFVRRLEQGGGQPCGYAADGSFACAVTSDQADALERLARGCAERGANFSWLKAEEAQAVEPALSKELVGALFLPDDHQVDNRAVAAALAACLIREGVDIRTQAPVTHLDSDGSGWRVNGEGDPFDVVVVAAGEAVRHGVAINGRRQFLVPNGVISPIKGQMLAVARTEKSPRHVLRFGAGYVAPKADRVVIGATSEPGRDDTRICEDAIAKLRRDAAVIAPVLNEGRPLMTWAGVRPGSADQAPVIGWTGHEGVAVAAGHGRNGILLSPLTGDMVADLVMGTRRGDLAAEFAPDRFVHPE